MKNINWRGAGVVERDTLLMCYAGKTVSWVQTPPSPLV